jgi:hypothetical protein
MGAGCACLYQALSEVISAPFRLERRGLVLRCPLAVPAAMGGVSFCEAARAAVVDRRPLPCAFGVWGRLVTCAGAKLRHRAPTRPLRSRQHSLRSATAPLPPTRSARHRGHTRRHSAKRFRILQGRKRHGRTLKRFWGHGLIFGLPSEQKKH